MKKIRMNCTATLDETFADFLLSRRAKGLAEKTLESYSSQWKACFSTPNLFILLYYLYLFLCPLTCHYLRLAALQKRLP